MTKRIRQKIKESLSENFLKKLKAKRRKKANHDKENYHKFYARKAMSEAEWAAMQAKRRKD